MSAFESDFSIPSNKDISDGYLGVAVIDINNLETSTANKNNGFLKKTAAEVVTIARYAFQTGRTVSVSFRVRQLQNLLKLLRENTPDIIVALEKDLGRHSQETLMFDVNACIHEIQYIIYNIHDWVKAEYPAKPRTNLLDDVYILHDPYGVVLVMGAWNFPINLLFGPVAGAIAAGNCVVLKPSEIPAETEALITKLVPQYLDKDCYQVYTGGPKECAELLEQRFDYIFFTGSEPIGRIVYAAATKYLTPVTLELGGRSPLYIDNTVNMVQAARRILLAKLGNAGQVCIAPNYVLCTREVQDMLVEGIKVVINEWYNGDAKSSPYYSKIATEKHWIRLMSLLEDKSRIAIGGHGHMQSRFVEPTVLTDITVDSPLLQQEIFGPILPIVPVENITAAINIINEGEKPLVIHIFSTDADVKNLIMTSCYSGGILINDTLSHFIIDTLPFGGVGTSGMGAYHGKFSFDTFTHKKAVFDRGYNKLVEYAVGFRYPPYSDTKVKLMDIMVKPLDFLSPNTVHTLTTFMAGAMFIIIFEAVYYFINTGRN